MKNIGETIRELRKRNHITQEKLAECLGVSFQSVSRWENGLAYPDITLIPVLARYFKVSTDVLFGMEDEDAAQRQTHYDAVYAQYKREGRLEERKKLMEEAVREFPHNFSYWMNLAEELEQYAEGSQAQREEYQREYFAGRIRGICQRVLEDCRDNRQRCRAVRLLCGEYVSAGNVQDAIRLAGQEADLEHCQEVLMGEILSGDAKLHQLQENMLKAVDYAASVMVGIVFRKDWGLCDQFNTDEKIQYIMSANRLYEILIPDGNYQYYHRTIGWNYRRLAELFLLKQDTEEALKYLLMAEREALAYDNLADFHYTAPMVNTLEYDPDAYGKNWEGSEQGMLLYRLQEMKEYFENTESREGYSRLAERLARAVEGEKPIQIQ